MKRLSFIIVFSLILFLGSLTAQPIKLTLTIKGASSIGDTFLLDEPIYTILTAKNVSSQNQKIVDFRYKDTPKQVFLERQLISEDGKILYYLPGGLHINYGLNPPKEEGYLINLSPGESLVAEIGELLYDYTLSAVVPGIHKIVPGRYRLSVKWRNIVSNEVQFVVVEPKNDLAKAYSLYKEAIPVYESIFVFTKAPKTKAERLENMKKLDEQVVRRLRNILAEFKKKKIAIEPYFVLAHELFVYAIYTKMWAERAVDSTKALEIFEELHNEHKKLVEEHPNTYFAQRILRRRVIGNFIGWVFPKWKGEDDVNYLTWLQSLTERYPETLVSNEAKRILETKENKK